jgi:hypothetical protein
MWKKNTDKIISKGRVVVVGVEELHIAEVFFCGLPAAAGCCYES